jgi:hypothetical protein
VSQLFPFGAPSLPLAIVSGAAFYQAAETGYSVPAQVNAPGSGFVLNSLYGHATNWQSPRSIRLGVAFNW